MSTVRSMHANESHETVEKEAEIAPSVGMECNDGENKNKKRKTSRQRSEVWDHFTKRMYSIDQASVLCSKLREVSSQLFNEYNGLLKVSQGEGSNFSQSLSVINEDYDDQPHNVLNIETDFQKYLVEIGRGEQKSELDKYINEELDTQIGGGEFDILQWWKANAHRFPLLQPGSGEMKQFYGQFHDTKGVQMEENKGGYIMPIDGTVVAVKCLAERGERFEITFEVELVAMAHLCHRPESCRAPRWCVHDNQLVLVYDYMPNRKLIEFCLKD
nr:receptor like protein kinase S.2 [Ipomoea batatas]